jgi:hypothetical protein
LTIRVRLSHPFVEDPGGLRVRWRPRGTFRLILGAHDDQDQDIRAELDELALFELEQYLERVAQP